MKVLASPLRRTLQTAANLLKSHPQVKSPEGLTIVLYPYLTEKVDFLDSVPVLREDLEEFTSELELLHEGIKFDYSLMNKLKRKNLWFLDIFHDQELTKDLLSSMYLDDYQTDSADMR